MHLKVITPPAGEPINVQMAKDYLRIDHTEEDTLIEGLIGAARDHAEKFLRRSLAPKTYEMIVDGFHKELSIPNPPLISIDNVTIIDEEGNEITPTSYEVKDREPAILITDYDGSAEEMKIQFQAGYSELPKSIEQALLLLVSHFYENREIVIVGTSVVRIPFTVEALLRPYKAGWF